MKKKNLWLIFVLLALAAAFVISGCDMNNPVTDEWWVGEEPEQEPDPDPDPSPGGSGGGGGYSGWPSGGSGNGGGVTDPDIIEKPAGGGPEIIEYTVHFEMNGGAYVDLREDPLIGSTGPIPDQKIQAGKIANEPGLVENSPVPGFAGWYNTKTGDRWTFSKPVTANDAYASGIINLEARWDVMTNGGVTVSFDGDFASISKASTDSTYYDAANNPSGNPLPAPLIPGATGIELSEPMDFGLKDGTYQFMGWYKDDDKNGTLDSTELTRWDFKTNLVTGSSSADDIMLIARWKPANTGGTGKIIPPGESTPKQVYVISFEDNVPPAINPTVNKPKIQYKLEDDTIAKPNAIDYPRYVFGGWYTDPAFDESSLWDFENTPLSSTTPVTGTDPDGKKEIKLYAKWTPERYSDAWFDDDEFSMVMKDKTMTTDYFPFQYDPTSDSIADTTTDPTWIDKVARIRNVLNKNPALQARIVGYKDATTDPDTLVSQREIDIWYQLTMDTGGADYDQLILNAKLPTALDNDPLLDNGMIFGENPCKGAVEPPDNGEVRVYLFYAMQ